METANLHYLAFTHSIFIESVSIQSDMSEAIELIDMVMRYNVSGVPQDAFDGDMDSTLDTSSKIILLQ